MSIVGKGGKMTTTMSIRDLARNTKNLSQYDFVEIEDKKSHQKRGLFVSAEYSDGIKKILEERVKKRKQEDLDAIMQFAGVLNGETENKTFQELKASKREKYENR